MEKEEYESKFESNLHNDKYKIIYYYDDLRGLLFSAFFSAIYFQILSLIQVSISKVFTTELLDYYPWNMYLLGGIMIFLIGFGEISSGLFASLKSPYPKRAFVSVFIGCSIGGSLILSIQSILMHTLSPTILGAIMYSVMLSMAGGLAGGCGALLGFRVKSARTAEWLVQKAESEGEYLRFLGEYERMLALYEKTSVQLSESLLIFDEDPPLELKELMTRIKEKLGEARDLNESMGYAVISSLSIEEGVHVQRGCEIIGGRFEYKVKVSNKSKHVITDVHIRIVGYPDDSLILVGEATKTVSRIEVGGFRSPQFVFTPTRDCVEGKVIATVSFMDPQEKVHTIEAKPYIIKSVCDLLKPFETTTTQFDFLLENMESNHQEHMLHFNAVELFTRVEILLRNKNFYIIDKTETRASGQYLGTMKGLAKGKYSEKRVAIAVSVVGNEVGNESSISINVLGEDIAMIPVTMEEFSVAMQSWTCPKCGGPLSSEQLVLVKSGNKVECRYCHELIKIKDYTKGDT